MTRLPPRPELEWVDGAPRSRAVGDTYFSRAGGLAESRAVFLAGCGLPDLWAGRRAFALGELGFGAGLNALATWDLWRRTRAPNATLHFVSIEGFPLTRDEAARALTAFPEVAPLATQLLQRWPTRARGAQRLWFADDGFALTVVHAPVEEALAGLVGVFDAWFLDGFAPARNAPMWSDAVMQRIATLSVRGARAASYSVAGAVRRALTGAGFVVEKREGFAGKRERLEAHLHTTGRQAGATNASPRVAIVGAGIAGASVVVALTRRGLSPVVFEAEAAASGASGNPVAIVSPRLDRGGSGAARMFLAAYLDAVGAYGEAFSGVGVEHRPRNDAERIALADLVADPPLPAEHMRAQGDGAFYPSAGVLRPQPAVAALLAGAHVRRARIVSLERADGVWRLHGEAGILGEADAVVLACGAALGAFTQTAALPLQFTRGQMEWGPVAGAPAHVIEAGPYLAPCDGGVAFGATFDRLAAPQTVIADADSRARNLAALRTLDAPLASRLDATALTSRVALRAALPDRVPIAGPAPGCDDLYLLGGLGSRGFLVAPLLGEAIACMLLGEPQALDAEALAAVDPARFLRRKR